MGYRPDGGFSGVVLAGLLVIASAWALSWIFAFFGVIARTAASVQGISFLILFPLTFLSNAYVQKDTLPPALQWFVEINPVTHLVSAARALTMGVDAGGDIVATIVGAAVVVAVFAPLTLRAYMRALGALSRMPAGRGRYADGCGSRSAKRSSSSDAAPERSGAASSCPGVSRSRDEPVERIGRVGAAPRARRRRRVRAGRRHPAPSSRASRRGSARHPR